MTRKEILVAINEIIEEEHGSVVTEDSRLIECGLDSFGYAMLFVGLEAKVLESTGVKVFEPEILSNLKSSDMLVKDLVDLVEAKLCM